MALAKELATEVAPWTDRDQQVLSKVENALSTGIELMHWWEKTEAANGYRQRFELTRTFNRSDTSFGFFDEAPVGRRLIPVMGLVEDMLFDNRKEPPTRSLRDEFREFVLHYFLRITDFQLPQPTFEATPARLGFGYSQNYYKLRDSGFIGKFSEAEEFAIVDLREIGRKYEWIVAKVRIFDFKITLHPLGEGSPEVVLPLDEESYLVLSRDFITNQDASGGEGEYGLGYAFLSGVGRPGAIAYGPGHFEAAFKTIHFRILKSGETRVRMVFAANQPKRLLNVSLNPVDWGMRIADWMSGGLSGYLPDPFKQALDALPEEGPDVSLPASWLPTAWLDKRFLLQHFQQHYQMIIGALLTWRRIPNWLDGKALPDWVRTGVSS
jgi:hypothetical protein